MSASDQKVLTIRSHIGTEVVGERRFPRPRLEAQFDAPMAKSNGAMLFGLRRIGKSSEAAALCERLTTQGVHVIKEDAQGKTSEGELLLAILRQLPDVGIKGRLTKLFMADDTLTSVLRDTLSKFTGKTEDVQAFFGQIASVIEQAIDVSDNIVLVIDEFPWLCRSILQADATRGRQRVDILLAALRKWRGKGMRMLLIGSIGMVGLGRKYQLDLAHLNDLQPLQVPPLTDQEAMEMCNALARGDSVENWTENHCKALLDETVAHYPVMLQKGFQVITTGGLAPLEEIPDLFAESVRPDLDASYYTQFDHRLKLYTDLPVPLPKVLVILLDKLFAAEGPVTRADLDILVATSLEVEQASLEVSDALQILREDGFVAMRAEKSGTQTWRIASQLVVAWRVQRRGAPRR